MKGQLIISIGREFGSGGHEIAQKLADQYKLPLYDHNLLDELAGRNNLDGDVLKEFDEAAHSGEAKAAPPAYAPQAGP